MGRKKTKKNTEKLWGRDKNLDGYSYCLLFKGLVHIFVGI